VRSIARPTTIAFAIVPQAGALAQRDPQQEQDEARHHRGRADAERRLHRQSLGEHRPWGIAELGRDQQRLAGAEHGEAEQQRRQAPRRRSPA
jgi:hypothetical protein